MAEVEAQSRRYMLLSPGDPAPWFHQRSTSNERYAFDTTTHKGAFETALRRGTLAAVSGQIAKQSPDAMKVR